SQDLVAHWISKLFDKKWQIEASMSYHREIQEHQLVDPLESSAAISWNTDPALNTNKVNGRQGSAASLSWFSQFEPFKDIVDQNCDVTAINDPANGRPATIHPVDPNSKLKIVCPVPGYTTGGGGGWENLLAQRVGARIAGTNFFRAFGHHQVMYGWDPEVNQFLDTRLITGGGFLQPTQIGRSKFVISQGWGYYIDKAVGPSASNVVLYPFKRNSIDG